MSLEQALNNLADAIKAQTALIAGSITAAPAKASKDKAAPVDDENDNVPTAAKEAVKAAGKKAPAPAPKVAAPATTAAAAPAIDPAYAPVKAAIMAAIAKGHRAAVTALLNQHGAKTGQDLDASVYDEVLGELDALVNPDADIS